MVAIPTDHSAAPPVSQQDPKHTARGLLLIRMVHMLALLALAVSALVYPLRFDPKLLSSTYNFLTRFPGGETVFASIQPYIQFGFSPLTIKESLTAWVLLPLIALWITWKILFASQIRLHSHRRFYPEFLLLILFFFWSLASVCIAPQFGIDSGTTYTAFNFTVWIFFFLALCDLPITRRFSRLSSWWIIAIGLILMLVSTGEAVEEVSKYVFRFMIRLDQFYKRNLYGGLIGHNTGVASICMGPFFFALGMLFHSRRWTSRIFLGLYVILSLYFFLVTQSRAVWILFLLLTPPFLLGLRRLIGAPIRLRHFGIGFLLLMLLIGSQFIPSRWNFLHIEDAPFVSRLQSLTPRVLLTETRFRIFMVSLPLIAERPIVGHGLSSFVSIYPKAQADYFSKNPNSALYPTFHLTDQAHNDYLQLILETGFLGFGLALGTAFFFVRRAWLRFRRIQSTSERLRRYCAFFALGEILLHAFIDFPFHIVPLATFFLFYAAMAYGNSDEDTDLVPAADPTGPSTAAPASVSPFALRPARVISLVVLFAVWSAAGSGVVFATKRLKADIPLNKAFAIENFLREAKNLPSGEYIQKIVEARELFRQSLRVDPMNYLAQLHRGIHGRILATIYANEAEETQERGDIKQAELARKTAIRLADETHAQLYRAGHIIGQPSSANGSDITGVIGFRVNHTLFHYVAQTWALLADLLPAQRQECFRMAFKYYQLTARYSPTYSEAITEMIDFMGKEGLGTPEQRKYYLSIIARRDKPAFMETYLKRVVALTDQERYQAAEALLLDMIDAAKDVPEYPELHEALVAFYQVTGNTAGHHQALEQLRSNYPNHPSLPQRMVEDLVIAEKYAEAEKALTTLLNQKRYEQGQQLLMTRVELMAELGRTKESRELEVSLRNEMETPSQFHGTRAYVRRHLFGKEAAALEDYEAALQYYPANIPTPAYFALIRDKVKKGDWQAARKYLVMAEEWNPVNEGLKRLQDELKKSAAAPHLFP